MQNCCLRFAGKQPLDTLAKLVGNSQKHPCANLALAFFVARELPLGDANCTCELFLVGVKAAQLAQASADAPPVDCSGGLLSHDLA